MWTTPCNVLSFNLLVSLIPHFNLTSIFRSYKWKPEVKCRKLAHLSSAPILIWVEQTMRDQIPFYVIKKLSIRGKINLVCHLAEMWKMWRQTYSRRPQLTKQPSVKNIIIKENQSLPSSNLSKHYKTIGLFSPFVRSCRIRWALLLALSLCHICKLGLCYNKAVKWILLILFVF